jgi:uncharacterized protein (TIGR03437 family)
MYSARSKYWIFLVTCFLGTGAASAQTISLVSGSGQLLDTSEHSQSQPMVVLLRDASGNPVKGASVAWTVTPATGQGNVLTSTTVTDATGQTSNLFTAGGGNLDGKSFVQTTVTATGGGGAVQFTLATVENNGVEDFDHVSLISPSLTARTLVGQAGVQGAVPVQVSVVGANGGTQQGQGIPNISLAVVQSAPDDPSTISCSGGSVVYTNAAGSATCTLVFGGKVGTGNFTIVIGNTSEFSGFSYQVTAGPPAAFTNLGGNNQSGNPGQQLPRFLTATLTDLGGNPVPNTDVAFSTQGAVTLSRVSTATDANGNIAAIATLGNGAGPVSVTVSTAGGVSATFNLTINVIVSGLQIVSGNQPQAALVNTPFGAPLVVEVYDGSASNPLPGVTVTFAVTSGSATLGTPNATSDANGQASTTVTAGSVAGPVTVTASATGTQGQGFAQFSNLTVTPPGPVCNTALDNGASFVPNHISPGGVAVIYCTSGVADAIQGVVSADSYGPGPLVLPLEVQHVTVEFGEATVGPYAPIYYVANVNGQQSIAVQVPFELYPLSGTTIPVTINANQESATITATIQQGAPGIFEYLLQDGVTKNAILLHADGSLVTPKSPALAGETLRSYVTGLIPPFNPSGTSVVSSNSFDPLTGVTITTPVIVGINSKAIPPPTVTYADGMIGVWEVQFVLPAGTPTGLLVPFVVGIPINGQNVFAKGSKVPIGPLP